MSNSEGGAPQVVHGDCLEIMKMLPDSSVDSIVTDPPYGLGFMGKAWDKLPPGHEWAEECLRVLKPGGHLLAFGGTRTWHRLAVAVEDAGFEIRDSIAWMYGSGFPKHRAALKPAFEPIVMARKPYKGSLTNNETLHGTGALDIDGCRIGTEDSLGRPQTANSGGYFRFDGFSTRAELEVVAAAGGKCPNGRDARSTLARVDAQVTPPPPAGRWPANVALDEHMAAVLDEQSGAYRSSATGSAGGHKFDGKTYAGDDSSLGMIRTMRPAYGDTGGASRFMYVAKAPKKERPVVDGVAHATVKPLALMQWLVRLVTPTGGTVLEPFAGSGTTVEACILEGFHCIAIEREAEYLPLIQERIDRQAA